MEHSQITASSEGGPSQPANVAPKRRRRRIHRKSGFDEDSDEHNKWLRSIMEVSMNRFEEQEAAEAALSPEERMQRNINRQSEQLVDHMKPQFTTNLSNTQ